MPDPITVNEIQQRLILAGQKPVDNPYPPGILSGSPQPAAVLLPFLRQDDAWHLLFIRRSTNETDRHGGQVAFPGGRADPEDDSPESTARREAEEEIGLKGGDVQILGRLNRVLTISNYLVTPVVGLIPWPYPLQLDPREVSRAFTIPLTWLSDPGHFEIRSRSLPRTHGSISVIYFDKFDNELLWGATARITLHLLEALGLISNLSK